MTDKVQKIREEVEMVVNRRLNLLNGDYFDLNKEADGFTNEIMDIIDSLQEEPVSIWYDSCEIPESGTNILMIRKDEEDSNYPPIAGCFHGTNSRLDGKNWGYYNGFCYNEIEPPVKWAYIDDLQNLSNVRRTVKDWKEEPVSIDFEQELYKAFGQVKDFTLGMRIAKWFYEMGKNSQEPVSEELETEIEKYLNALYRNWTKKDREKDADVEEMCRQTARHFAKWQKEQFENSRLEHCDSITNEQAELEQGFIDKHLDKHQRIPTFLDAIEYGMNLQKEEMIKNAVDGVVAASAGGEDWVNIATGFVKSSEVNVKFGDKIKIIVVKEE